MTTGHHQPSSVQRVRWAPVSRTLPGVQLDGHALEQALTQDCTRLPGVNGAGAHLSGRPANPRVEVTLALDPHISPRAVIDGLTAGPLHRARASTGRQDLPTRVVLRVASHRPHRAD